MVIEGLEEGLVEDAGVNDSGTYYIWVDVRGWSSVLNISLSVVSGGLSWDSN